MKLNERFNLRLDKATLKRLRWLAKVSGITMSEVVRVLVTKALVADAS
jgi:antitoxin component of RelBE/YafQ-DinJ toxin-antitoxin module